LRKLAEIFEGTESLMAKDSLIAIFHIYKSLIALGDRKLLETLLSN